jgi:hypothetical protein
MASYVSDDGVNVYVDESGDSGMNSNYTPYSTAEQALANYVTNNSYYVNDFTDYAAYGSCPQDSSVEDGAGYVSDGHSVWMEGTAAQNQEGNTTATSCNPDCLSPSQACAQGATWPLLLNRIYGTNYQLVSSNEGFQLFEKKSYNILAVIVLLILVCIVLYFVLRK